MHQTPSGFLSPGYSTIDLVRSRVRKEMWKDESQEIPVVLSSETLDRLEQACQSKRRVADFAVEVVRIAIFDMYPPTSTDDWKDPDRWTASFKTPFLLSSEYLHHAWRRWTGRSIDQKNEATNEAPSTQLTLKIPVGFMKWIDQIAGARQLTNSQAVVYAIEHGLQRLDSQRK